MGNDLLGDKITLEGNELQDTYEFSAANKKPIIRIGPNLEIDDSIINRPTCILGNSGTGKTTFLDNWIRSIISSEDTKDDNIIIFAAKQDILKYAKQDDIIIRLDSDCAKDRWNLIEEIKYADNPQLMAKEIAFELFEEQFSTVQPFFTVAPRDIFEKLLLTLKDLGKPTVKKESVFAQKEFSNKDIVGFCNYMLMKTKDGVPGWKVLKNKYPQYLHIFDGYLGSGENAQALGVLAELQAMVNATFIGSFGEKGTFSAMKALKEGGKRIFLFYDYSKANKSSAKVYKLILNLLIKQALANNTKRRNFFILDEFSLLPRLDLINALSYGRELGFRIVVTLQSAMLLRNSYSEEESRCLLSLFYNIFCFYVNDGFSRSIIQDRYGTARFKVYIEDYSRKIVTQTVIDNVITDYDFSKITEAGNCIVSCPSITKDPFLYLGHLGNRDEA